MRKSSPPNATMPAISIDWLERVAIKRHPSIKEISGIAGDFGYPEELKLAHSTCVLSSLEILECQAAAVAKHGMRIEPDMHHKLFVPFR